MFFKGPGHGPTIHPTWPFIYWPYFCILCKKMGSRDCGETEVDTHRVQDPPWSFNGPCHGPTIHPKWPFIYWIYFCILRNKNEIKGLWGHKGQPSSGLGPALVLQWTLAWPYNTPNMALYILAISIHTMQQKWDQGTLEILSSTLIGSRTPLGPSMDPAMALYILAIFLHTLQQKREQGTLEIQRSTLIGSRTTLGPSMDPAMALQYA